jgi:predicted transcriptional regulator
MHTNLGLSNAEYRLASIIWENEPLTSPELCQISAEQLGWKRTTTYTVLKKLCDRSLMQNRATVVTSLVSREEVQQFASQSIVESRFDAKLPIFIATFLNGRQLTAAEADQIKALIDSHRET